MTISQTKPGYIAYADIPNLSPPNTQFCGTPNSPQDINMVFTHGGCRDGQSAIWAAHKRLGPKAAYHFATYTTKEFPDVTGKHVAVLDFHFPRDVTEFMMRSAASYIVLDHHSTAKKNLLGLPNIVLDETRSGCTLAWEYFHPGVTPPALIPYSEDYDRDPRFQLKGSREFNAWLETIDMTFEAYDAASLVSAETAIARGEGILSYIQQMSKRSTRKFEIFEWPLEGKTYRIHMVNTMAAVNEAAEVLLEDPKCDISITWYWHSGLQQLKFSVRSRPDGRDLALKLSQQFPEGGGHKQAAGFSNKAKHPHEVLESIGAIRVTQKK